ncbi:MAG TPA: tetratricopeptide repeat protein [Bryobacteraceae bacterium]|nr:tetratricopeptide repeat protein [Bryobacteraceae bacterium]
MRGFATVHSIAVIGLVAGLSLLATGCNKLNARDNLNQGVNSFKAGQYANAADHFKKAIELDPEFPVARLYLATAYMQQYVPGSDTAENKRYADSALEQFQLVLNNDPKSLIATQSVASLYYNMKDFAKAEEWNKKILQLDSNNKEADYVLGVIAWTNFVIPDREARVAQSMTLEAPGPLKAPKNPKDPNQQKVDLKTKYWDSLTQGIEYEKKALQIDPEYENAMSYMNLLIRYRADLDDTKDQYDADIKEANDWVQKSLETTKKKAERKNKAAEQSN